MVITRLTRNQFAVLTTARGFESHRLRQSLQQETVAGFLFLLDLPGENTVHGVGGLQLCTVVQMCVNVSRG